MFQTGESNWFGNSRFLWHFGGGRTVVANHILGCDLKLNAKCTKLDAVSDLIAVITPWNLQSSQWGNKASKRLKCWRTKFALSVRELLCSGCGPDNLVYIICLIKYNEVESPTGPEQKPWPHNAQLYKNSISDYSKHYLCFQLGSSKGTLLF